MEGEVTDDECLKAIRSLKAGKAVGDDKVANEMLKEGSALASQGCRVCFAHPISKNHTLFLPILTLGTLQNIGLHTQYW